MNFGTSLCQHRKSRKLSQTEIAEQIGTCQSTYSAWESDKAALPAEYFIKLAYVFEVELTALVPQALSEWVKKVPIQQHSTQEELVIIQKQMIVFLSQQVEQLKAENERLRRTYPGSNRSVA
ncbi:helix-turn-helix domain-containing protein [Larkinella sp. VNQ87]|uniref:helix-turn-helix domain-containing protein n=1 Tax=Larkinella sp. VNQ87 TaxID=3400921 RepID=UPI003C1234C1